MKFVVDTNIIFSGILKTESRIGQLLVNSKNYFDFYTVDYSRQEIDKHKAKILQLTHYNEFEYQTVVNLITSKIKYINELVIPGQILKRATDLVQAFDIDDAHFVALALYIHAKLWTGDRVLITNLTKRGFKHIITTEELYRKFLLKEQRFKRY